MIAMSMKGLARKLQGLKLCLRMALTLREDQYSTLAGYPDGPPQKLSLTFWNSSLNALGRLVLMMVQSLGKKPLYIPQHSGDL